jgi:hypothetical protein
MNYTAPESYVATNQERPATFSYLPAGTPPWPTTVPQNVHGVVASATQNQPASQANVSTEDKPRRTVGGVLSVIAVLVLAPIIGILFTFATVGRPTTHAVSPAKTSNSSQPASSTTPAATPVATTQTTQTTQGNPNAVLPTPTSFKTAKDTNVNISLQYPADWNWTPGDPKQSTNGISFNIASQDQIGIIFFVTHLNDTTSGTITNADQLNQSYIQSLTQLQNVHSVQNTQVTNSQPNIAGAKWVEKDATFLDGTNNKIHFATIAVQHGKSYYIIYFFIPDGIYPEAMKKYILPMLNSVQFLS